MKLKSSKEQIPYKHRPWIGVDLDGTLAYYQSGDGVDSIGAPIPKMKDRVVKWVLAGERVKIMTARACQQPYKDELVAQIKEWLKLHFPVYCHDIEVTNEKDFLMKVLYDDRAVQVLANTGDIVGGEHLR